MLSEHMLCGYLVTAHWLLLRQEGKARSVTAEWITAGTPAAGLGTSRSSEDASPPL